MEKVTFGLRDMHMHGSAFFDFLALRKRYFIDTLSWNIPHDDEVEMDQYDNPTAHYSLVMRDGEVLGGARIMPFGARWGIHGCMLQDATEGRIGGIPAGILPADHEFAEAWECTRLVLSDAVAPAAERSRCLGLVVEGLVEIASAHGAGGLVTLTVPPLRRALRMFGYDVRQYGASYRNPEDGRTYAVLHMPPRRMAPLVGVPEPAPQLASI